MNEVDYRLELLTSMKIHSIFHVSLLEPYKKSTISGRLQALPLPIEIDGEEEFEVSEILDSRINRIKVSCPLTRLQSQRKDLEIYCQPYQHS